MIRAALVAALLLLGVVPAEARIDRRALVGRHAVHLTRIDPHAPVMLGNGDLAFTADITGLQTFPDAYAPQSPLLTMAQWAWHSFPNPQRWTAADGMAQVPVPGRGTQPYAWFRDFAELKTRPTLAWLRENPHRFSLARVSLAMTRRDGSRARLQDLSATDQRLDLWSGTLVSRFVFDGQPVTVETRVDARRDAVLVAIRSPLVAEGRLAVEIAYPGVAQPLNPDPSGWSDDAGHRTDIVSRGADGVVVRRTIEDTIVHAAIAAPGGRIDAAGPHRFRASAVGRGRLVVMTSFDPALAAPPRDYAAGVAATGAAWARYWRNGGMIELAGSTDPRARELERRIVLSQYLARINQAGRVPPQEEGLFSNSWNGKFHLEMHAWHAAHFAQWRRPALLRRSMDWYLGHLPRAHERARAHRVDGAWWPKMAGPDGEESPSPINPFIMWQQPHPIYLAEMLRRAGDRDAPTRYGALVDATARLLASWPRRLPGGRYVLGPPIVPVQENHDPFTTTDPVFEVAYFRWALGVAQGWRERRGLPREAAWDTVIAGLPPAASDDGRYRPVAEARGFWRDAASARCRRDAIRPGCLNRDHPSFLMAFGLIDGGLADGRLDRATAGRTLDAVAADWDLRQTWGWDFPMIAMTAARLGRSDAAIDWLFADQVNNRWGVTGMTPRVELDPAARGGPDGAGFRRVADTYFPSNGALLLAVGMMAAGWDGSIGHAPGFPHTGWRVVVEDIDRLP